MKSKKYKVIIIIGAPGVGKTTVARLLTRKLKGTLVRLSVLRAFHLNPQWKNASPREADMAYKNVLFIVRNYLQHNYSPVIIEDILSKHAERIKKDYRGPPYFVVNLVMSNDAIQKKRVLTETRDSGYRNWQDAIVINKFYLRREEGKNEIKINTTHLRVSTVVRLISQALRLG